MDRRPDTADIQRLTDQLERDRDASIVELKQRDHAIGAQCAVSDPCDRLLYWLDQVAPAEAARPGIASLGPSLARLLALVLGFAAMAGFLLGSGRGLVNVFVLLAIFVGWQCLMSLFSAVGLVRVAWGRSPSAAPQGALGWLTRRSLPDWRDLQATAGVLRLIALRHGQALGALFTAAALLAFVLVPAVNDFSFVWGSTYAPGAELVARMTDILAAPWAAWWPAATVPAELVAESRYHPALLQLDRAGIERMRGWWPFLFMCLLVYALLPRLLLWLAAHPLQRRLLRRVCLNLPGSELVLARMQTPLVRTQGQAHAGDGEARASTPAPRSQPALPPDANLLLVDWRAALGDSKPWNFEELQQVGEDQVLAAGLGSLAEDREHLASRARGDYRHLLVVVKSWEPPVGELRDLLQAMHSLPRCTLYLVPLPGKPVPHRKVEDWRSFARDLPFPGVDVRLLNRVQER